MIFQTSAVLLAITPLSALAQSWSTNTKFTITLYPSGAEETCEEGEKGGISLTTETVPRYFTCIDVEAVLGGEQRAGFLNDSMSDRITYDDSVDTDMLQPPGIDWFISGDSVKYDSSKNWTNVWFEQRNQSSNGDSEEGKDGRWVVTVWPDKECLGHNVEETPWYETSCQTSEDGQCESVDYSIKGIGIRGFESQDIEDCQVWGQVGAASSLAPRLSFVFIGTLAYLFLL